jgi:hypothetical protein
VLFDVCRLVGSIARTPRPADLPQLPLRFECTARRPTATHTGSWLINAFDPIFNVADVARSVAWFARAGFETSSHDATYAFARHERGLTIHLAQVSGKELPGHGSLYLHCQDADRVAEDWSAAGIEVDGPRSESYGKREGSVSDPDGNVIRFGSPVRA